MLWVEPGWFVVEWELWGGGRDGEMGGGHGLRPSWRGLTVAYQTDYFPKVASYCQFLNLRGKTFWKAFLREALYLLEFVSQKMIFLDHCKTNDYFKILCIEAQGVKTTHHDKHQHQNNGNRFLDRNSISFKKEKKYRNVSLLNAAQSPPSVWLNTIQ